MKKHLPILAVFAIMLLSAALHFWDIDSIGDSNRYYTAAVESMTQSWHNFFYAAAEPGGSVTVDKPPLGLQIETLFALVLGVSGFSTVLPNVLAGILSVPLMYHLVKKHFGTVAGLAAALVMAATPVVFAADRNNTMDGMLTFVLLLAAWAFIKAVESGRARWLFFGAVIVGLAFNIKMLQAYLPVPAFFALYVFGAKTGWLKKIGLSLAALLVMAAVSLSWALYVDSVPAEERPYIGSSQDNTVMGLIAGHNGISRLFGGRGPGGPTLPPGPQAGAPAPDGFNPNASPDNPNGQAFPAGPMPPPPPNGFNPNASPGNPGGPVAPPNGQFPPPGVNPNGGTMFSQETGNPGALRFFQPPLGAEMSWLLPFALFSLVVIALHWRPQLPIAQLPILGLLLWGGWLMTCLVFFSWVSGIFHAYYVVMLVPALAGVAGGGFGLLWQRQAQGHAGSGWLLTLGVAVTVAFQIVLAWQYGVNEIWMPFAFALAALAAIPLLVSLFRSSPLLPRAAFGLLLSAMLVIPLAWSALTVTDGTDSNLPAAYGVSRGPRGNPPDDAKTAAPAQPSPAPRDAVNDALLEFLQANTQDVKYLAAVESSQIGAPLVIAAGRPVLYMGGFSGMDNVVGADDLAQMVANGELRYVLVGMGGRNKQDVLDWLQRSCAVVDQFSQAAVAPFPPQGPNPGGQILYECK